MTDEEWGDLTRYRRLPSEARKPIEAELDTYSRFATALAPPPNETKGNLERAAVLASNLLKFIDGFGPDEHRALVEFVGATPRRDALDLLADQRAQVTRLRDWMVIAAARIEKGKTGSDAGNLRAFLKRVGKIVEGHTGAPLSKSKPDLDFAKNLGKLADPQFSIYSAKGAIESRRKN
jgi:hypothetical protein